MYQLERERERHGAEASDISAKFMATIEEVRHSSFFLRPRPLLILRPARGCTLKHARRLSNPTPDPPPSRPQSCWQVKLRETAIVDLQKKIVENDLRLKTQQVGGPISYVKGSEPRSSLHKLLIFD